MNQSINQNNLKATLRMLDKMGEASVEQMKYSNPAQAEQMEKLGALLSDESFRTAFLSCADKQAAVQLFADHGLTLTAKEVELLVLQIKTIAQKLLDNNGELSEEDLEQINGGSWLEGVPAGIVGALAGGAMGSCVCPVVGTIIGALIGGLGMGFLFF